MELNKLIELGIAAATGNIPYLRKQGLVEMTLDEFTSQAREAAARLYASGDIDSARIVAMAAK